MKKHKKKKPISLKDFDIITDIRDKFGHKIVGRKKNNLKLYNIAVYKRHYVNEEVKNLFLKEKELLQKVILIFFLADPFRMPIHLYSILSLPSKLQITWLSVPNTSVGEASLIYSTTKRIIYSMNNVQRNMQHRC
jgi:hypothetical protein